MTNDQVKQVKEANDVVDVIGGYVALRPSAGTWKGLCPFHDDRRPSFDVDPRRQRYRCWSCGKYGDVISFIQEYERLSFREALEILARRAGISLDPEDQARHQGRLRLFEVVRWAAVLYHQLLLDDDLGQRARDYLGQRQLLGPTIRKFGVGFAPAQGDWLVRQAHEHKISLELLETAGLIAKRQSGQGYYDRFRDRVLFPIRDPMGRPVGFGGRIIPGSPLEERSAKYYNSPDTPLFSKSDLLYGLDQAKQSAPAVGSLVVVEGYTDVLMAHQCRLTNVVATMGTALTARHVHVMRRFAPRVILVYDADAGGDKGVDNALAIFASQEVDLAVATLPEGLDPCDLLTQPGGKERFQKALASAVDALDFKLQRVLAAPQLASVEGRRRAVDEVLSVIALAPEMPGQAGAVKRELIVTRISHRLTLKEETVWARLEELRRGKKPEVHDPRGPSEEVHPLARPAPEERQLAEILLADPTLVPVALAEVSAEAVTHPGLRQLIAGLYELHREGRPPTLDQLRLRLDNPRLIEWALRSQEAALHHADRASWLQEVLAAFQKRRLQAEKNELTNQLRAAQEPEQALAILRQLQQSQGGL